MRVIIAGSRSVDDNWNGGLADAVHKFENTIGNVDEVISGCAKGADELGEAWADLYNIPVTRYPAQWTEYGRRAGIIRNEAMGKVADGLIALWDGSSKGTKHMIECMAKLKKPIVVCKSVISFKCEAFHA